MKRLRIFTLIIVVLAAIVGAGAYAKRKQDSAIYPAKAHHVIYAEWKTGKDGNKFLSSLRVRDVEASGAWKEWTVNKASERIGMGDHSDQTAAYRPASFFRSAPNLVREETILGLTCFTLDVGGARMSYSPEFGMTPLRLETDSGTVVEALKIY